jgi:hypothetical protein
MTITNLALAALAAVALSVPARAAQVLGHGHCDAVWDTGTAAVSGTHLDCTDGDPSCDTDGAPDHTCHVAISACAATPVGSCVPRPLTKLKFGVGASKLVGFAPPVPGGSANCGASGTATIPLRSKKHGTVFKPSRPLRLLMRGKHFTNTLLVRCLPCVGASCNSTPPPTNCAAGQKELTLTVPTADRAHPELGNGSDLDNGWTGTSHNFPVIGGSSLHYCLTCDASGACQGSAPTGAGTPNTATFGAPLPLLAANVPVCVVNNFVDSTLTATYNLQTGEAGTAANPTLIHLTSQVFLRTTFPEVCPKCQGPNATGIGGTGTCSNTAKNPGAKCTVNGEVTVAGKGLYELSSDCAPLGDSPPTGLDIPLRFSTDAATPITGSKPCPGQTQDDACGAGTCNAGCTGAACVGTDAAGNCIDAKGGIAQLCCSNATAIPCFPTKGGGSITRTGHPGLPGQQLLQATTFCIAATDSTLINITTGLPGPGALLLPAQVTVK